MKSKEQKRLEALGRQLRAEVDYPGHVRKDGDRFGVNTMIRVTAHRVGYSFEPSIVVQVHAERLVRFLRLMYRPDERMNSRALATLFQRFGLFGPKQGTRTFNYLMQTHDMEKGGLAFDRKGWYFNGG